MSYKFYAHHIIPYILSLLITSIQHKNIAVTIHSKLPSTDVSMSVSSSSSENPVLS